ncbi:MAG: outer membrane beta-barrel family protein [Bacteroidota bacterium]
MKLLFRFLTGLILPVLLGATAVGQNNITVKGTLLDSLDQPMVGATVMLLQAEDSVMKGFSLTDTKGRFLIPRAPAGEFVVQITRIGYGTFARPIVLSEEKPDRDLGVIKLNPRIIDLDEVVIEGSFIPIVIKKDTIEYNANAFKTKANATVEDLLKKLPGIEVEKDGTIKAQGEEVQNVLVDGKEFFDDDPKIATRNIPADVVDKVQVFDKDSDLAEFTGIEDGNEEKTINLAIKDGKNKGWFGKLEGAYGLDERYRGNIMLNRFDKKLQLSLIGNGNNTNEQAFSINDYLQFSGALDDIMFSAGEFSIDDIPRNLLDQSGINETRAGGLNLNYDFSEKTKLRSNYFGNFTRNFTGRETSTQNLLENGVFLSDQSSDETASLTNHRGKIRLTHAPTKQQKWILNARIGSNDNEQAIERFVSSSIADQVKINDADQSQTSFSNSLTWQTKLQFMQNLKKKGRFISASASWDQVNRDGEVLLNNLTRFYLNNEIVSYDTLRQLQTARRQRPSLKASLNYSEPLGKAKYLQFKVAYQNQQAEREKLFFDSPTPSNEVWIKNELLSASFDRVFDQWSAGPSYKIVRNSWNWTLGANYQRTNLARTTGNNGSLFSRNFDFVLPYSTFSYSFTGAKQFRTTYRTSTQIPSVDQMQPVLNNSNPLVNFTGNPDLQPEYRHSLSINYTSFNQFYQRSLFVGISSNLITQKIINVQTFDEQLVSTTMPVNGGEEQAVSAYFDFSSPLGSLPIKGAISGNARLGSSPIVLNAVEDRAAQTAINSTFRLENRRKSVIDLRAGYTLGYNQSQYQQNAAFDQTFLSHTWFGEAIWFPSKTWTLDVNVEYTSYSQEIFGDQQAFTYLDAGIHKTFKDNQFDLYLTGKNLLNQDFRLNRNGQGTIVQQTITQQLGRVVMLGLIYKLRRFGK